MWNPPPMGCVSGCTYPSGLLVDRAPRHPMGDLSTSERPKAQKVLLGLSEHPKTSYTYEKFDLGDLGAPKRSKALKTQLCDSDPSEHPKTSYTYAKMRK